LGHIVYMYGTSGMYVDVPEIGTENRYWFLERLTCNLKLFIHHYDGTEFCWYRFSVTNRTMLYFRAGVWFPRHSAWPKWWAVMSHTIVNVLLRLCFFLCYIAYFLIYFCYDCCNETKSSNRVYFNVFVRHICLWYQKVWYQNQMHLVPRTSTGFLVAVFGTDSCYVCHWHYIWLRRI